MSTINEIQDEIIEEFSALEDWMDRYALIIDLGNTLEPLPESDKTPTNIIEGCQSRVWITASYCVCWMGRRHRISSTQTSTSSRK